MSQGESRSEDKTDFHGIEESKRVNCIYISFDVETDVTVGGF